MFESVEAFYQGAIESVKSLNQFISDYRLGSSFVVDHICYKVSSSENFERMRQVFESDNRWLYQSTISKRRIAIIRTNHSILTSVGKIDLVELSDQKPDGSQVDSFDHIEVFPIMERYDERVSYLQGAGVKVEEVIRPHHTTHDIRLDNGFLVRLTKDRLVDKIVAEMK